MDPSPSTSQEIFPLSPHYYPLWVKGFGVVIGAIVVASLVNSAPLLLAGRQLTSAGRLTYQEDFKPAVEIYLDVLKKYPEAFEARLGAAVALFSEHQHAADLQALQLLQGARIDETSTSSSTSEPPAKKE